MPHGETVPRNQIQYHSLPPWTSFPHPIVLSLMMGLGMEEKMYMQSFCPLQTWARALWLLTTPQENISIATVTIKEEAEAEKLSHFLRSPWIPVQVWIQTQVWVALIPSVLSTATTFQRAKGYGTNSTAHIGFQPHILLSSPRRYLSSIWEPALLSLRRKLQDSNLADEMGTIWRGTKRGVCNWTKDKHGCIWK